ncbi:MAG: Flp pilus assembly complex ATPase component TadA [Elusimicrobia bacterium]|nr:Flp pilus assembly complex ATPase component TadA [Elusimicrobiota bacterium]
MPQVLIVDDDSNVRSLVKTILEMSGFQVRTCPNGNDCVSLLGLGVSPRSAPLDYVPDLFILDYEMRGVNGFELLRRIRQSDQLRKVPVIMMTATTKEIRELVQFDVTFFLKKPFDTEELLGSVQKAIPGFDPAKVEPAKRPEIKLEIERGFDPAPKPAHKPPARPAHEISHRNLKIPPAGRAEALTGKGQEPRKPPARPPEPPRSAQRPPEPPRAGQRPPEPPKAQRPPAPPRLPEKEAGAASRDLDLNLRQLIMRAGDVAGLLGNQYADWSSDADKPQLMSIAKEFSPLIKVVDEIMAEGISRGASDIHLEPQPTALCVRMRIDGLIQPVFELPESLSTRIAARLKILANLDISERRVPQDGRFSVEGPDGRVDFRVSTLPSIHGEKVVLRLLRQSGQDLTWESLALGPRDRGCIDAVLGTPQGLVLVTGPTGSGKTTTLYTMLKSLNTPYRNIVTVEDPVEYEMSGITQVAVYPEIGLTFDKVLRSFLRQDPNVILVGEMRDLETAEIGLRAAVTGHLVLSTIHTNSAPATVARLISMGIKPYLIVASLRVIIAQRLVRLLCPDCKEEGALSVEEAALLSHQEKAELARVYVSSGCKNCSKTGYAGRKSIFEVMPIESAAIKKAVLDGSEEQILQQAKQEGMVPIRVGALELVKSGATSPNEAFKILLGH